MVFILLIMRFICFLLITFNVLENAKELTDVLLFLSIRLVLLILPLYFIVPCGNLILSIVYRTKPRKTILFLISENVCYFV